jgi:hypothetical protein
MSWLLLAAVLFGLHAGIDGGAELSHVRSTDSAILEIVREGSRRSETFRSLVDALNQTGTIVYVERGVCGFGHYSACLPHAVTLAGNIRYLRILIDSSRAADMVPLIAHELQHALEIARAPAIRTADDITALFRRIGRSPPCPRGVPDCYETSEALAIGDAVLKELRGARVQPPGQ